MNKCDNFESGAGWGIACYILLKLFLLHLNGQHFKVYDSKHYTAARLIGPALSKKWPNRQTFHDWPMNRVTVSNTPIRLGPTKKLTK